MNPQKLDQLALQQIAKNQFGLMFDVKQIILPSSAVSPTARATVFLTSKKQLYVFLHAKSKLVLSDVKKIVSRMGLKAELFVPPKGQPQYFEQIGRAKFSEVFPGRSAKTEQDIAFYKTLAPYNPALIQIKEVKNGTIFIYDSDAAGNWRAGAKFAYRRIRTS